MLEPDKQYLSKHDYQVRPGVPGVLRDMVRRYHYARGCSNTGTHYHGLFNKTTGDCVGAALWMPPTKPAALSVYPDDFTKVVALSRLVVVPGMPTNAASFLVAGSVRLIRMEGKYRCLLTYADEYQGHTGAIYKATNWEYLGPRRGSPTWVDPQTGQMVAKLSTKTRTTVQMTALGYERIGSFTKHKYRMVL